MARGAIAKTAVQNIIAEVFGEAQVIYSFGQEYVSL